MSYHFNVGTVVRLRCKNCMEETLHQGLACIHCRCIFGTPVVEIDQVFNGKRQKSSNKLRGVGRL